MQKKYLNYIDLKYQPEGNERRYEMLGDILRGGTFLPNTVEYKDIDESFTEWVKSLTIVSDEGKEFPTMTLFSNQRFSEYSQSWKFVDSNKNLLLNFKTITRENNPKYGKIQSGLWNIPGERFYQMKKKKVLDDNGTESFLVLEMRQPVAIDLLYKVSIFTTKYSLINEFNTLINKLFSARQCYIQPNGHYMPMTLENISDESQYSIDDRQFYSQTYQIQVLGYIITEEDMRLKEVPLKRGINFVGIGKGRKRAKVELEEMEYKEVQINDNCGVKKVFFKTPTGNKQEYIDINDIECPEDEKYFYKPLFLTITLPPCETENGTTIPKHPINKAKFAVPTDINFAVTEIVTDKDVRSLEIFVNGEEANMAPTPEQPLLLRSGDEVTVSITRGFLNYGEIIVILRGYSPNIVLENEIDNEYLEEENILSEE